MNTEQNYAPRDYYAIGNPPPANPGPKTTPAADQRPPSITSEQVSINKDVYLAQEAIMTTVSDFLLMKHSPTEAVGHVLRKWLATGPDLQPGTYDATRF